MKFMQIMPMSEPWPGPGLGCRNRSHGPGPSNVIAAAALSGHGSEMLRLQRNKFSSGGKCFRFGIFDWQKSCYWVHFD